MKSLDKPMALLMGSNQLLKKWNKGNVSYSSRNEKWKTSWSAVTQGQLQS